MLWQDGAAKEQPRRCRGGQTEVKMRTNNRLLKVLELLLVTVCFLQKFCLHLLENEDHMVTRSRRPSPPPPSAWRTWTNSSTLSR